MFSGLVDTVLGFVQQYGYLAVFVYMVLETSFILHFAPSEIVVPFAASQLVHGPLSFALFVVDTTVGATLGSVLAYYVFGHYGGDVVERYGHVVHVSERDFERGRAVFTRYGESSVFWGRMLPFVRALISIPAGLAEMAVGRFVVYSAGGAFVFNLALTYLVYTRAGSRSPLDVVLEAVRTGVTDEMAYVATHTRFVLVLVGIAVLVATAAWLGRDWIRDHPAAAKLLGLHLVRIVGLFIGGVFVLGALSSPEQAFEIITSVWNDPRFLVQIGFSEQVALALTGILVVFGALLAFEVGKMFRLAYLHSLADRMRK